MNFKNYYNNILKEDISREKRIQVLKSMPHTRSFDVKYYEYDRYSVPPVKNFNVNGDSLFEALKQLPEDVFEDVFLMAPEDTDYYSEEELKNYLNDGIDIGGFSFIEVWENGEFLCGIDGSFREEADEDGYAEIDWDDPDRQ